MKKSLLAFLIAAAPFCVFAQLPSYLPTDGLVGWWPFNGNANDESGNNNNGAVNGATLTSDRFGNPFTAYGFDGGDWIEVLNNSFFNDMSNYSISVWINKNQGILRNEVISKDSDPQPTGDWSIYVENNLFKTEILANNTAPTIFCNSNNNVNDNNWEYYVLTRNISDGTIKLFRNGVSENSSIGPFTNIQNNSNIFFGKHAVVNLFFNGKLDDIAIYNRALTPEEITSLYTGVPTDNNGGGSSATTTVPAGISYQAIARNAQGQPLSDTNVQLKFTLLTDSLTGAAEYSESHSLTTNSLGLFTTAFGAGTPETGTFAGINWASGSKYLKVEIDAGSGFVDMGSQQLMSVPYALQAKKSTLLENNSLPVFSDNAAALSGGLQAGQMYRTATGDLKIVY